MDQLSPVDERLQKIEQVTIKFDEFKDALRRNYLDPSTALNGNRTYVLRLYPPFEPCMEAEYHESEQGRHYSNDWDEKPFHIRPELIILDIDDDRSVFFNKHAWPTYTQQKRSIEDDPTVEATEERVEEALDYARDWFWTELKAILPSEIDLGCMGSYNLYEVDVEWVFDE